jgi:hypothetical protein
MCVFISYLLNKVCSKKEYLVLLFFLIAIHAFYFGIALRFGKIYTGDSAEYLQQAVNIKEHGSFYSYYSEKPYNPFYESLRPPVYSIFIMLVKNLINSDFAVLVAQNLLHILLFYFLYRLVKRVESTISPAYLIIISLLLFPATLRLTNSILSDQLFQFSLFMAFLFLLKFLNKQRIIYIILYNLLLVIGVFIKPALLYFWVPNMFLSFYIYKQYKDIKGLNRLTIIAASFLLPVFITLWCVRNEKITGYYHFSSISTQDILECYAGNALTFRYNRTYSDSLRKAIMHKADTIKNYADRSRFLKRESIKIILEKPFHYAVTHIRGMAAFMLDPGRLEIVSFFPVHVHIKEEISFFNEIDNKGLINGIINYIKHVPIGLIIFMGVILIWNVVLLSSFLLFVFNSSISLPLRLATLLFIGYFCSISVFVGYARFRSAVYPILIFTLPFFINQINKVSIYQRFISFINRK